MQNTLTMDTVVDFKFRGTVERVILSKMYDPELHGTEEDYFSFVDQYIQAGKATIVDTRSEEEKIADQIAREIMQVNRSKTIQEDRVQKETYNQNARGVYGKVGFPAKSLLDAQEMQQMLMKNFYIKQHQLGVESKGSKIIVTITNCPVKTYNSIARTFGMKRATETVAGTVDKTAKTLVSTTDMAINSVAVPVAKTTIGTGAKIAKSLLGFTAKLGGVAVSEIAKATKECVAEVKSDGYLAEARGEVTDGIHSLRRAMNKRAGMGMGGIIMDEFEDEFEDDFIICE